MKIVILCILGAICTVNADTSDILNKLQDKVNEFKKDAVRVWQNLQEFEYEYPMKLESELAHEIVSPVKNIETIVRSAHQEIHALHQKLNDNEDAKACCVNASAKLNYIGEKGNSDLNVCLRLALTYLDPALELMMDTIESADKEFHELEATVPKCGQQGSLAESCLERDIKQANQSLNTLATKVHDIKEDARMVYEDGLDTGRNCIREALEEVQTGVDSTVSEGKHCIDDIHA